MGNYLEFTNTGGNAIFVAVGKLNSCVIFDDLRMKCWGSNVYGQLGFGHTNNSGDEPNEMGDYLPFTNAGTGLIFTNVEIGNDWVMATTMDMKMKGWGLGDRGQLGQESADDIGDEPGEMGDYLPFIQLGTNLSMLDSSTGDWHTCVRFNNGELVKCWGDNWIGALGYGNNNDQGKNPGTMGDYLPFANLGTGVVVSQLAMGNDGSCVMTNDGKAKCFGWNDHGALGYGDTNNRGNQVSQMGDYLPFIDFGTNNSIISISSMGEHHACVILDSFEVKCWGANYFGFFFYFDFF